MMSNNAKQRIVFLRQVSQYVNEYNQYSGIHGLQYLTEKRSRTEKVFWASILLISLFGCIYMILEIIEKYQTSPVITGFANEEVPIYDIPFPAVTICPEAKFSADLFNYTDVFLKIRTKNESLLTDKEKRYYNYALLLCKADVHLGEVRLEDDEGLKFIDDDDFFKTIDELVPYFVLAAHLEGNMSSRFANFTPIMFDGGICYSYNVLNHSEIFRDHVATYAKFYQVNETSEHYNPETGYSEEAGIESYPKRALMSGADNALGILIGYYWNDTDYLCNGFEQGLRVFIHNPGDVPRLKSPNFRVPRDKNVIATVDPVFVTTSAAVRKMHSKKRQCYFMHERPLTYFKRYSQSNCLLECLTNYTFQKCGCVHYYMPRNKSTPICRGNDMNCTKNAERELKNENLKNKSPEEKICDCKPQCSALSYRIEVSHSDLFWKEYSQALYLGLKGINVSNEEKHFSFVSMYFQSEQFTPMQRNELYGIDDLISNFGGLLGLFTGFSLISLAEIIYFLTLRIFYNRKLFGTWIGNKRQSHDFGDYRKDETSPIVTGFANEEIPIHDFPFPGPTRANIGPGTQTFSGSS